MDDYHLYLLAVFAILVLSLLFLVFRYRKRPSTAIEAILLDSNSVPESSSPLSIDEEQELIEGIKEFQGGIVREVMVPRIDVVAVDESTDLDTLQKLVLEKGHSRIPVYRETIDHITGIAYVKDMLRYWRTEGERITVVDFMRPPYFVPETKNIGQLLHEFQAQKVHIAVAIDEYGGTAGIVTIEDLLEVVFGDIVDEHDAEEDLIKVLDNDTWEVNAKANIDELEDAVGELQIEQQDFETVGGLLFSILGEIPQPGDEVTYHHLKFTILNADKHRIVTVRVERMAQGTPETEEQAR